MIDQRGRYSFDALGVLSVADVLQIILQINRLFVSIDLSRAWLNEKETYPVLTSSVKHGSLRFKGNRFNQ